MRKLLFVIPEYSHGGTNKSLENMLSLIDKTKYDVAIYCLYEDGGEYYKEVFAPYVLKKSRLYYWLHDNVWTRKVMGLYNKLTKRSNFDWLYRREVKYLQRKKHFDAVIGFQEGTATEFVSYFTVVNRIAWIHCDYAAWANGVRRKADEICYSNIDQIVCVSESARKSFVGLYPEWKRKTHAIYNVVRVNKSLHENSHFNENCFNIVSVGRLSRVKRFEKIPEMVADIKNKTDKAFCWYIIGSGASEAAISEKIAQFGVQDHVILLGPKDNPYPYMQQADTVVCTSDSESFSYVIAEAKILHTPVISNTFPVAYEVVDEQTGWVASLDNMPQLIARLINDENGEYSKKKKSIMGYEYSNKEILKQIDELFQN